MRHALTAIGLMAIVGGGIFASGSEGLDALIAAVCIICGVVLFAVGVATTEVINSLQRRDGDELP